MADTEFRTIGGGFLTGTICTKSNLYKCTDNNVEYIAHISAGDRFPNFPGGTGRTSARWFPVTITTDGNRTKFQAVRADTA